MNTESSFDELVLGGGDERLDILSNGLNKYFVHPTKFEKTFNRASCTCSPFTEEGFAAAKSVYDRLSPEEFDKVREEHTRKIKSLINYEGEDRFDVFYAPSGSDLCYYPLLFASLTHPDKPILNLITCPEELGSGSNMAFAGHYCFKRTQFGESVEKDTPLSSSLKIESKYFPARAEDGTIIDHKESILKEIRTHHKDMAVNANLVIGSKSGIENNVSIVSRSTEDVQWTIDLCQFRASRRLINGLIGMNCSAMLTGSKFYQSPPFCAVLLVPKTISARFKKVTKEMMEPFQKVFSRYDIPKGFPELREHLPEFRNYGLLLRWESAIQEMLALNKLDSDKIHETISKWNESVASRLSSSPSFKLMPDYDKTNKTIVSFRVKNSEGEYLRHGELSELYKAICSNPVEGIPGYERALFGQPVKYGERSFIRIALGSADLRNFVESGFDATNDLQLIDLIEKTIDSIA